MRAAASSNASGRPSSRRQISPTAAPFSLGEREVRFDGLGPSQEKIDGRVRGQRCTDDCWVASGAGNGATRNSCSLRSRSAARLVISTFS